jgi:putative molybdopterin biosynthesis protein
VGPPRSTLVIAGCDPAAAIAAGLAEAGVASEPAALTSGLAFVPLAAEHFDLVIPAGQAGTREVQALLKVLSSRWLLDQVASLPGDDPARCGEHIATVPPAGPPGQPAEA